MIFRGFVFAEVQVHLWRVAFDRLLFVLVQEFIETHDLLHCAFVSLFVFDYALSELDQEGLHSFAKHRKLTDLLFSELQLLFWESALDEVIRLDCHNMLGCFLLKLLDHL